MDLQLLYTLVGVDGVLFGFIALTGFGAWRTGRALKKERTRSSADLNDLRAAVVALQAELAEMKQGASVAEPSLKAFVPTPPISADRRAEALAMMRDGADQAAVGAALCLSPAETALLHKVQGLLSGVSPLN